MTDHSPEFLEVRQAWWDKRDLYGKELESATHFYQLEKYLFIAHKLDYDKHSQEEDQMKFEMLEDGALDAQLKVLEICSELAKKKVSLDLAREEMNKAKEKFDLKCNEQKEVATNAN